MPFVRQPLVNPHIMSILCNATKFNVRRGILPVKGTRFRPQSTIQRAKSCPRAAKSGFSGSVLGSGLGAISAAPSFETPARAGSSSDNGEAVARG
jgi:hypothetical protein